MDPNATLDELRELLRVVDLDDNFYSPNDARRFVELVRALDEWLCGGGALPEDWQRDESDSRDVRDQLAAVDFARKVRDDEGDPR
jgi:hypothetical protein